MNTDGHRFQESIQRTIRSHSSLGYLKLRMRPTRSAGDTQVSGCIRVHLWFSGFTGTGSSFSSLSYQLNLRIDRSGDQQHADAPATAPTGAARSKSAASTRQICQMMPTTHVEHVARRSSWLRLNAGILRHDLGADRPPPTPRADLPVKLLQHLLVLGLGQRKCPRAAEEREQTE